MLAHGTPAARPAGLAARLDAGDATATRIRWCWAALLLAICVHLSTVSISPTIWQDEVQMVEFGRSTVVDPSTAWSVNMLDDGRSVPMISFVAPLLEDLAYRLFAPWAAGPRLASLFAACAAMVAFYAWLRRRGNRRWESLIAAGLLFFEPAFTASYRGARVDAWAMLACFSALALLRSKSPTRTSFAGAGAFIALGQFMWPSFAMLVPLVLAELWSVLAELRAREKSGLRAIVAPLVSAAAGGIVVGGGLLAVLVWRDPTIFDLTASMLHTQFGGRPQSFLERLAAFCGTARTSPVLLLSLLLSAARLPGRALTVAAVVELGVLLSSVVYVQRILYLMPYAAALVADALRNTRSRWRPAAAMVSVLALLPALLSLGVRTVVAIDQREGRDPARLEAFGRRTIGAQPARVYLEAWDFYYVGRELGWHMVRPYGERTGVPPLFLDVDYAIVGRGGEVEAVFMRAGMRPVASMERPETAPSLFKRLGLGARPYGDFTVLVARDKSVSSR